MHIAEYFLTQTLCCVQVWVLFSIMVTYSTLLDMMQHQWVIGSQHLKGM